MVLVLQYMRKRKRVRFDARQYSINRLLPHFGHTKFVDMITFLAAAYLYKGQAAFTPTFAVLRRCRFGNVGFCPLRNAAVRCCMANFHSVLRGAFLAQDGRFLLYERHPMRLRFLAATMPI